MTAARPPNPDALLRAEFRTPSQTREKAPGTRPTPKTTCFPKNAKERVLAPSTLRYGPVLNRARPSTGKFIFFGGGGHQSLPPGQKKIRPGHGRMKWAKKSPQRPTFPPTGSIIGDGELNFRVRNGIGWILPSMATGKINKLNQEKGPGIGNDNKAKPHDLLVLLG